MLISIHYYYKSKEMKSLPIPVLASKCVIIIYCITETTQYKNNYIKKDKV